MNSFIILIIGALAIAFLAFVWRINFRQTPAIRVASKESRKAQRELSDGSGCPGAFGERGTARKMRSGWLTISLAFILRQAVETKMAAAEQPGPAQIPRRVSGA